MVDPAIEAHYGLGIEESRLFSNDQPRLEHVRTLKLLDRFLPAPPARILDVGGATGAYAVPLCAGGYSVDLVDPMALHVERAQRIANERGVTGLTASIGDARDLGEVRELYDAVLLLGPLYHLTEAADRALALREAIRVARSGAVVVAAGISRFASLLDGLRHGILDDPAFRAIVERDLVDGQHRNPDPVGQPAYFTTAYFHRPEELELEALDAGLVDVQLFAVEGPAWLLEQTTDLESQLVTVRAVESERSMLAATSHMLIVGTTPT